MKIKLYLDFDGVILDTIRTLEKKVIESGFEDAKWDTPGVAEFILSFDWGELIQNSFPLNDSISNIQKLLDSNLYDIAVLTHVNSIKEEEEKRQYLDKFFENLSVIPVWYPTPKYKAVDCKNTVLVDDSVENLILWEENGGISVKFSIDDEQSPYITVNCLDKLIDKYQELIDLVKI